MQMLLVTRLGRLVAATWWSLLLFWLFAGSALLADGLDLAWMPPSYFEDDLLWLPTWQEVWPVLTEIQVGLEDLGLLPLWTRDWPVEGIPLYGPLGLMAALALVWSSASSLVSLLAQARLRRQPELLSDAGQSADAAPEHLIAEPVFQGAIVEGLEARLFDSEESLGQATEFVIAARQALLNASLQPESVHLPEDLAAARSALDGLEQQLAALRGHQHALMAGLVNLATDGR